MSDQLPKPQLSLVYRLEARLGEPLDLGETALGRRRIVPQTAGTFSGPEISGRLLPGASADWQTVLRDGTALADIRYTLQTDSGSLLYVRSQGVRHGSPEVLARLARGADVDGALGDALGLHPVEHVQTVTGEVHAEGTRVGPGR